MDRKHNQPPAFLSGRLGVASSNLAAPTIKTLANAGLFASITDRVRDRKANENPPKPGKSRHKVPAESQKAPDVRGAFPGLIVEDDYGRFGYLHDDRPAFETRRFAEQVARAAS